MIPQSNQLISETDLWLAFINGEKNAFSLLYKQSYKKLYSYGIGLGMTDESVRDIIQELFIKLYSKPQLIKDAITIKSYLFTSIRNAFINSEKFKQKHLNIDSIEHFEINYTTDTTFNEENEDHAEMQKTVEAILAQLTSRQKEIIYLRFLQQMEYNEIVDIMNLSEQAARNLIYRALEKARKIFSNQY